ncbi:hypothetical protein AB6A40_001680 [Gnathostoma spinigerum]|uniref:Zinc transporter ZIP14 n=1 Tax=Gnathostoma spinigerum TaxID=75299 RepID=A0ABD6E731_9BILA
MVVEEFDWTPSTSSQSTNVSVKHLQSLCSEWLAKVDVHSPALEKFIAEFRAQNTDDTVLKTTTRPSSVAIWLVGLLCVTLISMCAAVGILFVRGLSKRTYNHFITVFVSLGVGSLITSSSLHLLPQGLGIVDNKNYDFIVVELFAIFGIYTFFFCDKFIKISLESKKLSDGEAMNMAISRASTDVGTFSVRSSDTLLVRNNIELSPGGDIDVARQKSNAVRSLNGCANSKKVTDSAHGVCVHDHEISFNEKKDSAIATVAWMIVFGDGLHNLIDGISIGAAFSESLLSGISVSIAVMAEEFPHELGDVAILLNAGMTLKQTLIYNLLSTVTCFIGFGLGVLLGSIESFLKYIFGFSGGMFLYIGLACMMPEMKNAMEDALLVSRKDALIVLSLQSLGLILGTLSMFFFARYGDLISII